MSSSHAAPSHDGDREALISAIRQSSEQAREAFRRSPFAKSSEGRIGYRRLQLMPPSRAARQTFWPISLNNNYQTSLDLEDLWIGEDGALYTAKGDNDLLAFAQPEYWELFDLERCSTKKLARMVDALQLLIEDLTR